jgi:hypothetical protein
LNDPDTILENLAWHLTLTGVTIYRNECLSRFLNSETAEKYPNFVQLGLLLEIAAKGNGMYWIDERLIDNHPKKKSYWSKNLFHVFLEDWSKTIGNIPPEYSKKSKEIALLSHSEYTGLLGQKDLEQRRIDGIFDFKTAFRYCGLWRKVTGVQWARIVLISVLPISMLEKLPKDRSSLSYWKELRRKYRPAWLDRAIKAMKRRRKKG